MTTPASASGHGEHDDERVDEGLELRHEDEENEDGGGEEPEAEARDTLAHRHDRPLDRDGDPLGKIELGQVAFSTSVTTDPTSRSSTLMKTLLTRVMSAWAISP